MSISSVRRMSAGRTGHAIAASLLFVGILVLAAGVMRSAVGCGSTPPPISCGFAYNFAMGGVLTLVAENEPQNVTLSTFHYLSLLGSCPPGPYLVTMFAVVEEPGGRPLGPEQQFGPFAIESFSENVIDVGVQVLAGGPREAQVRIRSEMAIIDGRVLEQIAVQPLCLVGGSDGVPDIEIVSLDLEGFVRPFAPGGPGFVELEFRNNTTEPFFGEIVVGSVNAATLARTVVGPETPTHRPYSISDPVGDAFQVEFLSNYPDGCVPESSVPPHERLVGTATRPIEIPPNDFVRETILVVAPGVCGAGKCDNSTVRVVATGARATLGACAGFVPVVNLGATPANCPGRGRAAMARPGTFGGDAGIGFQSPDPSQPWQANVNADLAGSSFTVDGKPGDAAFVDDVIANILGQYGRIGHDRSQLNPSANPDSIFEVLLAFKVQSPQSDIETEFKDGYYIDGAPTGRADEPIVHGEMCVRQRKAADGAIDPKIVEYLHQSMVILVTETFDFLDGEVIEREILDETAEGYTLRIVTRAPEGSTDEPIIGFTVFSDFRAFVKDVPVCPEDVTGNGVVDFADILAVLAAWGQTGGPADINGDMTVNFADLLLILGAWGDCVDA